MVAGTGFRFSAPAGWTVQRTPATVTAPAMVTAARGDQFVRVETFATANPYSAALFAGVAGELKVQMTRLAKQGGGRVAATGVTTAAGIKAHVWRIATGANVDEYTFVFRGKREYQLLCHRSAKGDDSACTQLVSTFQLS